MLLVGFRSISVTSQSNSLPTLEGFADNKDLMFPSHWKIAAMFFNLALNGWKHEPLNIFPVIELLMNFTAWRMEECSPSK